MSTSLDRDSGLMDIVVESAAPIDLVTMASSIYLEILEEELGQWSLTRRVLCIFLCQEELG